VKDEPGHVRAADRGTLFLDEVADLPLASQGTLLRVLQEQEVTPVGAARPQHVDVRFVTATHRDLDGMVARGEFRQDLYARLAGFVFKVPPLRDRRVDLGLILSCLPSADFKLRPEAAAALMNYDWPLNIRELGHCLMSAALLCSEAAIGLADLPDAVRSSASTAVPRTPPPPRPTPAPPRPPALSPADCALRDDLEKRLAAHSGNIAAVARDLGKARQQVYRWIRRFGLLRSTEPPSKLDDRE
jgi:transcriptional regulator of acetoin/glycerol metabolism